LLGVTLAAKYSAVAPGDSLVRYSCDISVPGVTRRTGGALITQHRVRISGLRAASARGKNIASGEECAYGANMRAGGVTISAKTPPLMGPVGG